MTLLERICDLLVLILFIPAFYGWRGSKDAEEVNVACRSSTMSTDAIPQAWFGARH
jgi:hypothetical protein